MTDPIEPPWFGVDLDGTMAFYPNTGHNKWAYPWNKIGAPIEPMVRRMRRWIDDGKAVRIMTARVYPYIYKNPNVWESPPAANFQKTCLVTGDRFSIYDMIEVIQEYTMKHVGLPLACTCAKDWRMIELWDDRAIQVRVNTGHTIVEEHEALKEAHRGKAQG